MIAVISLLVILVLSVIVTRIGAVALRLTGMSEAAARFQARSALSGAGFTTSESEQVVSHPVRRRIVGILMLIGNIGIVAASGTLILSLIGVQEQADAWRLVLLAMGLIVIFFVASSKAIDRLMCGVISWALGRWTQLETRDFVTLLHLQGDYRIAELQVEPDDWMAEKPLGQLAFHETGIVVLGVESREDGTYHGAPGPEVVLGVGDRLIVYGLPEPVAALDCRCEIAEDS